MYYSEKFNSITHLVGTILALLAMGALLTVAFQQDNILLTFGFITFGVTLVTLYSFSTLYHSFEHARLKGIFKKLDHVAIYFLIAGTYTPFLLVTLIESKGLALLVTVWSLAAIGVTLEFVIKKRIEALQLAIYLSMGWLIVLDFSALELALPAAGVNWLIIGGIAYTIGVIFYVLDNKKLLKHSHGIWHLFVLTGSICHFVSIIAYVR